ncbi:hypothetical protein PSACC_02919 [Paramicrosporidium saccamoebae]|uniref:Uncharacterized protein n=1 Tax=Paramicrosporidium saccamoebae TaxID=1246581 RepID=A0A2H9TI43_9FUNG|nr:hypothetical protein PSACC_02919 [Paramicrosporidium saccamoebae]
MSRKRTLEDSTSEAESSAASAVDSDAEEREANRARREAARRYLESLQETALSGRLDATETVEDETVDAEAVDRENIAARLRQDVLQTRGKVFRNLAEEYRQDTPAPMRTLKGPNYTPTCVAFSADGASVFAGFKSGDILQWNVVTGAKMHTFVRGHSDHVLCMAVSPDGVHLVSGGKDKLVHVWSIPERKLLTTFKSHRGPVTGLAFQLASRTLFSASTDRTVKLWDMEQLAYVDTLFGHQDEVICVDALSQERCLTVGARDRTVRLWKVPEESQLVFRGLEDAGGRIDVATLIDSQHFASASDTGAISLWGMHKKKPLTTQYDAHTAGVTCLYSFRLTDLLISASDDGMVRLWRVDTESYRSLELIREIPVTGTVNGVVLNEDGSKMALAVGKDHRLGRWNVNKSAKNRIVLVDLK